MLFANHYLAQGGSFLPLQFVGSDFRSAAQSPVLIEVIKADLDFVASNWNSSGFDLWEEVNGMHFYTRLVPKILRAAPMQMQYRALYDGVVFASSLGDSVGAAECSSQAQQIVSSAPF
jgi:glucoamylase